MPVGTYVSIITLNVNGLNAPTKRYRRTEYSMRRETKRKLEWQSLFQTKQTLKNIIRDKEGHYRMIKGSIQEEDVAIVNVYAPNIGAPQYIRQILTSISREINSNTIIIGGL